MYFPHGGLWGGDHRSDYCMMCRRTRDGTVTRLSARHGPIADPRHHPHWAGARYTATSLKGYNACACRMPQAITCQRWLWATEGLGSWPGVSPVP
eukprot:4462883-Prymnesium_polylepis.1